MKFPKILKSNQCVTKQKIYRQLVNPFSYTPEHAMLAYKSSESYKINDALRNGYKLTNQQKAIVKSLDKYLNSLPNYNEDMTYRALTLDPVSLADFANEHSVGSTVKYKAYTSTSKNYDDYCVDGKSNVILGIIGKNGKDVSSIGITSENEVLFKRNSKFKVINNLFDEKKQSFYAKLQEID